MELEEQIDVSRRTRRHLERAATALVAVGVEAPQALHNLFSDNKQGLVNSLIRKGLEEADALVVANYLLIG